MPSWRDRFDLDLGWRAALCAVAAVIVGLGLVWPDHRVAAIGVICLTVGCWPFLAEAFDDLCHAHMSMELSMLCAIAAAAAIGEWVTALMITTFVLVAEILEDLSMERGRDALTDLMAFLPDTVRVRRNDGIIETTLAGVTSGDLVVISPGDRIAVDGLVETGASEVDQSRITGEPMPVAVRGGDRVLAGSVSHGGALEVRVEHVGANSSYPTRTAQPRFSGSAIALPPGSSQQPSSLQSSPGSRPVTCEPPSRSSSSPVHVVLQLVRHWRSWLAWPGLPDAEPS